MSETSLPDRASIAAEQLEQLRSLVAELFPANRFYTQKLQAAGVTFDIASLADFSARFPFTTKAELVNDQANQPAFGTNLTYPIERYTRFHQTSGTRGAPLRWLDTPESWQGMIASWTEVLHAASVRPSDRVYFAFSFGPFIGFWLAFESAAQLGCLCLPGGGLSTEARCQAVLENGVTVLCCTPTYAIRLGEVARLSGRKSPVRTIIVAGEPGGSIPATRQRIERLWPGARVFDHHGMTEVGPVTYECPSRPGVLHVIESAYYAEVIHPVTTLPASHGELVLTTLNRAGSPLLRYRTGDVVRLAAGSAETGDRCACGCHYLALEGGILGRVDDMLIVRGVNVYPAAVEEIVRRFPEIAEYRVRVSELNALTEMELEIELDAGSGATSALPAQLSRAFETWLALRIPVRLVPPGTLPRFDMKAQRWVRS